MISHRIRASRTAFPFFPTALLLGLAACASVREPAPQELTAWFAADAATRGPAPDASAPLDLATALRWRDIAIVARRDAMQQLGKNDLAPLATSPKDATRGELRIGELTMPYVMLQKGERPADGWPLWICLHGGGGNDQAQGPHEWIVNTREWEAQQKLFERVYSGAGLYFIPRMADDRRGRWWFDHNQRAFDEVIEKAIAFCDVDPNRVYLMGISEGGYGAIRFAGNRPDRFAACGGMAAAEPLSTSPPENMRNVAVRIDIGEKDSMFDRIGLARRMGAKLAELRAGDPEGYVHDLHVQKGRGHGIDYSKTPQWLMDKARIARPTRVEWTVLPFDTTVDLRSYWLALRERPSRMPLRVTASRNRQRIEIQATHEDGAVAQDGTLLVRLDDSMCSLDQPVEIVVNGKARTSVAARRSIATIARTLDERGDPHGVYCAEIEVPLAAQ